MVETALGRFTRDLAVDLGTANTLVWAEGRGVVLDEPSVVAVMKTDAGTYGDVLAVGTEAREMLGRTPGSIVAMRPLQDGVIADFQVTEEMLRAFIRRAGGAGMVRPRVVVCVPYGLTEVEKRAVHESARSAGSRDVILIPEPMAAALGAGLPILDPVGNLVVDIGGGTTEVAVISLGGAVAAQSLRIAGDAMNHAIIEWLKEHHGIHIGDRAAEALKLDIGTAVRLKENLASTVKGRDVASGIPRQEQVRSEDVRGALQKPLQQIVEAIRRVLEGTSPELSGDILERGLVLCGGGSLLRGMDLYLRETTGLPVNRAEDPLRCTVVGAGKALEDSHILERIRLT
ncbi:MAG: rod shape-determining protein [Proteobacteria bacterium]|nr:rod shape-determining protein [Pseudomonadota bacterium]